jgi:hypothetical protein
LKQQGRGAADEDQLLDFHQAVSEVMEAEEQLIEDHKHFILVAHAFQLIFTKSSANSFVLNHQL